VSVKKEEQAFAYLALVFRIGLHPFSKDPSLLGSCRLCSLEKSKDFLQEDPLANGVNQAVRLGNPTEYRNVAQKPFIEG
jgi:hypothetical protein